MENSVQWIDSAVGRVQILVTHVSQGGELEGYVRSRGSARGAYVAGQLVPPKERRRKAPQRRRRKVSGPVAEVVPEKSIPRTRGVPGAKRRFSRLDPVPEGANG